MSPFSWVGRDLKAFRKARAAERAEAREARALVQIAENGRNNGGKA